MGKGKKNDDWKNYSIGGMSYNTYDPERDPYGDIGHALADLVYKMKGPSAFRPDQEKGLLGKIQEGNNLDRERIATWARIALKRFPETCPGETIHASEIKSRFSELRKAGYNVKGYSSMNKRELWDYLREVRNDIHKMAKEVCPDVLREIYQKNNQAREDTFYLR